MIFYYNNSRKINSGFSIIEIVISIVILSVIGVAVFQMYKVISDQRDDLDVRVTSLYFSQFVDDLLRKTDIPESYNIPGSTFYFYEKPNEEIDVSQNPLYYNSYAGFQNNSYSSNKKIFTQEITFISKMNIKGVEFYNYKVDTSLNGVKNTIYTTK